MYIQVLFKLVRTPILQQLQWPTFQEPGAKTKVTMMYWIVYHLLGDMPTTYLIPINSIRGHGLEVIKLEYSLRLQTGVCKQPIIALYFESENELKFYNLEAMSQLPCTARTQIYQRSVFSDTVRLWNSLPQTVLSCPTIDSFMREVLPVVMR